MSENQTDVARRALSTPSHVVGVGASAGGLDPLVAFFDHLPRQTGMAFVIVQHLSPDFKSVMDELLRRHTELPIHLVENGMPVEADHVYLIPSKKEMIVSGGRLLLTERDRQQELTLPIDVFFRSLAQDAGPRAVAIVLSGGGSDGSRGIREVHDAGGLVIVQDAATAQFDGMPRAALETGAADHVLAPEAMPAALVAHAGRRPSSPPVPAGTSADATGLEAVYRMLQEEFGIDFTHYKPSTVTRRIDRRLSLARSQNIDEYVEKVRNEREELDALYHDLLIGVTRFFRDPEAFALLEQQVLPELFAATPRDTPLRLWVAGCATGEEAYSLAIVVHELLARLGDRPVKIFATDVHRGSLERAALAAYEDEAVANVSRDRLARYFTRVGGSFQVVPELRQNVVFARHDVIRDAPFTRIDLITCRNLLIYLQPSAQQRALSFFHFSLRQGGVLMLGPSEGLGTLSHGFEMLDKRWQLYRKHGEVRTPLGAPGRRAGHDVAPAPLALAQPIPRHSLAQLLGTYDALLDDAMPPSLLVGENGELVHAFGGASRFLRLRDGRSGLQVLDLVDDELKMVLMGGLKRALTDPTAVVFKGVRLQDRDDRPFRVTVRRVRARTDAPVHLLVTLETMQTESRPAEAQTEIDLDQVSRQQMAALEAELSHTKESLQAAIEQLEASNEELQASNEELQASNEELQSTNEELQSVNEELYTVNAEYQRKITELTELTNDMDNLLASTEVGTIFLDGQLRIRRFTPQVAATFDLVPHDVGRPIEAFAHKMDHPELLEDLRSVLATGQSVERDLRDVHGQAFFLRIFPYRAKGNVAGVVLTLIDVSGLKSAEDALFHERYLLNSLLRTFPDAIYFKDATGRFIRMNHAMATRLGLASPVEAVGRNAFDLPNRSAALALHREDESVLRSGQPQLDRLERAPGAATDDRWDVVTRLPLVDREGHIVGIIVIFRDVTEQKRAEAKIHEAVRLRDQFLAMLSHELRNPLGAIVTATAMLKQNSADGHHARNERKGLGIVERQALQMARLLDDLLEASRVTQNKIELRRRVVDLRKVAAEAADAVRATMDERGLSFEADLPPEPVFVDGDPARLQQIQVNLLSNAAKYTPKGGHVTFTVGRDGSDAVLRVRDDGAGLPAHMADSIFDLFVQATRTIDRADGGLGLGLTLVRSLVEMHGGTVTAESAGEGQGSTFVVRLPQVAAPEAERAEEVRPSVAGAGVRRVMVVEDNADSREALCALLEAAGYDCRSAGSGGAALALATAFAPEIAILDLGLPELDGFELARRLRRDPRHVDLRLVALTGYGQATDRAASLQAGFDEHIVKPVQPDRLLDLLAGLGPPDVPVAPGAVAPPA